METENKKLINSCLMLGINLNTPIHLCCLFDDIDLKDTGVELDSHITLLYAQGKILPKENILTDIKDILGEDYSILYNLCKTNVEKENKLLNFFELDCFENDSDYIILKLKKSTSLYRLLYIVNKGLRVKYNVKSDFDSYTPHITLAELEKGKAQKYMNSEKIQLVLKDSSYNVEDIFISYGEDSEKDRDQYFLTNFSCIDRYFRLQNLQKNII